MSVLLQLQGTLSAWGSLARANPVSRWVLVEQLGLQELQDRRGPARTVAGLGRWVAEARGRVWIRWNQLIHMNTNLQPE